MLAAVLLATPCRAQYTAPYVSLSGTLSASNGMPAQNYVLSFQPNQLFFVGGTSVVVSGSTCATDSTGVVVGVRNPLTATPVAVGYTGTLPIGNYWVEATWYDSYGNQTLASPAASAQLTAQGQLVVSPPSGGAPANAIGMDVYIGTSVSALAYQGQTTAVTASFTQSTALATGVAPPTRNGTVCQVVANDAGWPTGTGYQFSMTDPSGNTLPGYPVLVQFLGPGSAYNLSSGLPYYNGRVIYPVPVLTQPTNHNMQSINGPLSMGQPGGVGYNIVNVGELGVGTSLPGWGVDVEGSALAGAVNAATGYLVNGNGGTAGYCLGSDGSYYDVGIGCITAAAVAAGYLPLSGGTLTGPLTVPTLNATTVNVSGLTTLNNLTVTGTFTFSGPWISNFYAGTGTATIAAGGALGSGGTAVCNSPHVCDTVSGEILATAGSSPSYGNILTVTFPTARTNGANCVANAYLTTLPVTTLDIVVQDSTTTLTVVTDGESPLTASRSYVIDYWCGGS